MAEIFRPVYTTTDPTTGQKIRQKSPTWWIRYYTPDGKRHKVKGYRDKKATETKAAELERRGIRQDAGLVDPAEEHAKKPLKDHADDFGRQLSAKGNTREYIALVAYRLTAVLEGCRFVKIADIQPSAVVEFLGTLRAEGKSTKTANDYLAAVKGFTRFLWRDKRCVLDPLAGMQSLPGGDADLRHARRDFSHDELDRLLSAARESRKPIRKLPGPDRYALYLTACATGYRASELAKMTPESFNLDGDTPTARAQASCTKNRKEGVQPLPLDVAAVLRDYLSGKPAGKPVWPGKWKSRAFIMVKADMRQARKTWLESIQNPRQREEMAQSDFLVYQDKAGRYADFHSLRHSYITMVGKLGVSPREHQDLARHSTYALTSRYSHSRLYDLAAAVRSLPIPMNGPQLEASKATGTDGSALTGNQERKSLGPFLGPQPAISGDSERQAETVKGSPKKRKTPGETAVSATFPRVCDTREKVEPTGVEPVTSRMPF